MAERPVQLILQDVTADGGDLHGASPAAAGAAAGAPSRPGDLAPQAGGPGAWAADAEAPARRAALWRPRNVARLFRRAVASFRPQPRAGKLLAHRLQRAERRGLQFAILCRTVAFTAAAVFYAVSLLLSNAAPTAEGFAIFGALIGLGVAHFVVTGTRFDRRVFAYGASAVDILAICAIMAFVPLSRGVEVPLIFNFRAFGIHVLLPFVALAALSLSPRLVLFAGGVAVAGWWAAFGLVVQPMEERLSWSDVMTSSSTEAFFDIVLSPAFIGTGTRMGETLSVAMATLILALAVARARRLFFAQARAEAEREAERATRARLTRQLGRFVPPTIARRIIEDPSGLAPQVRHGAVLVMDVQDFSAFAHDKDPGDVIAVLNAFLAAAAESVGKADGVVITFTGDGLLATFNTPLEVPAPEAAALEVARELLGCGRRFGFAVRVGVAAGPVAAGSVGSESRQAFTVYGDTVNRAARLEALAKDIGGSILVDANVARASAAPMTKRGRFELRGLGRAVSVWMPSADPRPRSEDVGG